MSCTKRSKEDVIKAAEKFAKFQQLHIVVVIRGGKCNFYEKKYQKESDILIKEFDFTPEPEVIEIIDDEEDIQ